ncbi:MAG: SIS domain-containing protein [Bdellovibrionota bacterium]
MSQMLDEVQDAPNKVRAALKADEETYAKLGERLRELNPALVATIARGSSDHAAAYAAYLFPLCTGRVVASIPPSVVTVLRSPLNLEGQFALAISQGGGSPDIIQTLDCVRRSGALTAALVNSETSELARTAEILLPQHAGVEKSIAATKSVICTLTGIARIAAAWSGDQALQGGLQTLPGTLERAFEAGMRADAGILAGISNVYVLSRGLGMAAALEIALKLKETCGVHAEAFSAAEVRHGPREIVDKRFLIIVLALPGSGQEDTLAVARELKAQGAGVLLVAPAAVGGAFVLPELTDSRLSTIVALELIYPWIARAAKALGRDPDRPKTLTEKVIKTV